MFRIIINGQFEDLQTLEELCEFIKKNWRKETTFCNIKRFYEFNCITEITNHSSVKQQTRGALMKRRAPFVKTAEFL